MEYAYIRVSSNQSEESQLTELSLPQDQRFVDHCSCKETHRPAITQLLARLTSGDTVHVQSFDRIARNLTDMRSITDEILKRGGQIKFHTEGLLLSSDTSDPSNLVTRQIFKAFFKWEETLKKERQADGFEAARKAGKQLGRPSNITQEQKERVKEAFQKDILYNVSRISRETGVPRTTCHLIRQTVKNEAESSGQKL